MAKSGLRHIDVGPELTRTEWESEESHELVHGTSFPASPVERQLFYRDDEHKWYVYNGSSWIEVGGGHDRQHSIISTADHTSGATSGKILKADANGLPVDATNTDAEVSEAVSKKHDKQHSIVSTGDHTSAATSGKMLKADANGLPVDGSNTDTEVDDAVTKKHSQLCEAADFTKLDGIEAGADVTANHDPKAHKASHQNGGSDEISVAGLAGEPTELTTHKALETGVHGLKGGVSFGVYQTSDQTIAKDTTVVLNWHAESWDIGGYFDLATEKFTPLVAGKYLFLLGVQIKSLSADEDLMLFIDKNGVWVKMVARVNAGASSHLLVSGACILDMNGSTDYVRASVMHYDSVDRDTWGALGRTWFQGYLLPQL